MFIVGEMKNSVVKYNNCNDHLKKNPRIRSLFRQPKNETCVMIHCLETEGTACDNYVHKRFLAYLASLYIETNPRQMPSSRTE